MSEIKHEPGTFCWAELMTGDSARAKTFYSGLLGWETHDDQIPGGGVYTMATIAGGNAAGMFQLNDQMKEQGVPPHWLVYVSVADADATAAKAKELGGTVVQEPFDVMDIGRMATIQDPSKATFAIWQPKKHHGFGHNEPRPGVVCWNELATNNVDAAGKFYASLFDWKPQVQQMPEVQYTMFKSGDNMRAGMMPMQGEMWQGIPPHWMLYFAVESCAESVEKAEKLGGKIKVPPTQIPNIGIFSVIEDPTGVVFSIIDSNTGQSS